MLPNPVSAQRAQAARLVALGLGAYAFLGGLLSFLGWAADVERLADWTGDGIAIQPNTSVAAMMAAAALVLLARSHRRSTAFLALLAGLIGATALFEHLSGIDLGIDTLLMFGRPWGDVGTVAPGRMGPPASISWSFVGTGLILALGGRKARQGAAVLGLAAATIAALSLIGYIFAAEHLYSLPRLTAIAMQTSSLIFAVGVGLVAALPDRQPTRTLLDPSAAGLLARRALPLIIVLPVVLGVLRLLGEAAGFYGTRMGLALMVLAVILMMSGGLWWGVAAVALHERALAATNVALRQSERRHQLLADLGEAFAQTRDPGDLLQATCRLVGEHFNVSRCGYARVETDEDRVMIERDYCSKGRSSIAGVFQLSTYAAHFAQDAEAGKVTVVSDLASDPRTCDNYDRLYQPVGVRAYINVPLRRDDEWVASFWIIHHRPREWTEEDVALLRTVADRIWLAVENARYSEVLRENEERFRRLANAMPQIVYVADANGNVIFTNQQWQDYAGGPEPRTADLAAVAHPDDVSMLVERWEAVRESGQEFTAECRLRRAEDGVYRWFLTRALPIRDEQGSITHWYGTSTDIHERKRAEEQLRQAAKMGAIGRLAGGIAHDFNNQLNAVSGFANFAALDPGLGARARQDLQEVIKAAERMAGLTRQLLAFSRQQVLQPETLELNAAVLDGASLLQRLIGSDIQIALDLTADPTWVRVDRAQLLQILMNLTINARDAMPQGGRLSICTGRREITRRNPERQGSEPVEPGAYVVLTVADSGTGIAPEHLPYIFEPFFTTKEVGQGTGLGLATVHGIVTQSQGHIWARSEAGQGTIFTVLLPSVGQPAPDHQARPKGREIPAHRARILIVDDEDVVRAFLGRTLVNEGYDILEARNGREALDCLDRTAGTVDVVLSDVLMPELGGRALAARLAAEYPDIATIWMSGYPHDSAFGDGDPFDPEPFLQKPIPAEVLVRTLRDVVAKRTAVSETQRA